MKWFSFPALSAAALLSAVVVVPFLPQTKPRPNLFVLEAQIASSAAGVVKIYYDIGGGYSESGSAEHAIAPTTEPQICRFPLPAGSYHSIRFDPIDGPGHVTLAAPIRILSSRGREIRHIPFSDLRPLQQIESQRESSGGLEIVTTQTANDPQMVVTFSPPLPLGVALRDVVSEFLFRGLMVFIPLGAIFFAIDRLPHLRTLAIKTGRSLPAHPFRAVAIVAAIAVVTSAYPVVFLGKSYVSPNFGTTLIYEGYPSLPGYSSSETASANGSDVGSAMWQAVPYSFMQHRALTHGELPLWNRYNSAGTPLLAQGQSMFGDPLHLPVVLFDGASWAWDLKYLLSKWVFACGLGLAVLAMFARQKGAPASLPAVSDLPAESQSSSLSAALVVTFAAPFIGFYLFRINHPAIFTLSYAPWVLCCWLALARATSRHGTALWAAGLFAANFALMNSGTVKEASLLLLQMNLAGASMLLSLPTRWTIRLGKLAVATWTGILLVLVTTPVWATFFPTLQRAYTASTHAHATQIQPSLLLGAFDELFFRPLSRGDLVFNPALNVLLLLGVLYFLATLRLHFAHPTRMMVAACVLGTLAFAFGVVPAHWIVQVPLLANVGHIENGFLCGFLVFGSLLAGLGFATAANRLGSAEGRGDLMVAGTLLAVLVFAWIGFRQAAHRSVFGPGVTFSALQPGEVIPVSVFIWLYLVAVVVAGAGLVLAARRAILNSTLTPAAAIMIVLCAMVLLWRQGMHTSSMGFANYVLQPPARANFHARSAAMDFVQTGHQREPGRLFGMHGNVTPGWNAACALEAVHGPDALQNAWLRTLIDASPLKWSSTWRLYLASQDVAKARPFLDALNVRYYLDLATNPPLADRSLQLVTHADLDVYESRTAWPRAFFTSSIHVYAQPAELMTRMLSSNGRPFAAVQADEVTSHPVLASLQPENADTGAIPAMNYALKENTTSFDVRAPGPGLIVLTEAWWPDAFRAEINGRRVPIVRVNHAFKGVMVDAPGEYRVKFSYWPRNFTRHLILAVVGAILAAASLFIALRPARKA